MISREEIDVYQLLTRLDHACVAGCTCMTKTPDIKYHASGCHYRLFVEASVVIRNDILMRELDKQ